MEIQSILLRLPNWLGDGVMSSPCIEWIKEIYPNAEISIVGSKASCEIFKQDKRITKIFIDETKGVKFRILATKNLAQKIGKHDLAITFSNTFFSALLLKFTKSKIRIGYAKNFRSIFLTHAINLPKNLHQVKKYLYLLLSLEAFKSKDLDFLSLMPLKLVYKSKNLDSNKKHIGINPGAAYGSAKRWKQEYFVEIILYFLNQGHFVYLFGTGSEGEANKNIATAVQTTLDSKQDFNAESKSTKIFENFFDFTNKTTLRELIDYISSLDLFISNDSGPMHIAAATKTPLVAIFGPTDFNETSPYYVESCQDSKLNSKLDSKHDIKSNLESFFLKNNCILLSKKLPCSPCKKRTCPLKNPLQNHQCMRQITPNLAIESALKLLDLKN